MQSPSSVNEFLKDSHCEGCGTIYGLDIFIYSKHQDFDKDSVFRILCCECSDTIKCSLGNDFHLFYRDPKPEEIEVLCIIEI